LSTSIVEYISAERAILFFLARENSNSGSREPDFNFLVSIDIRQLLAKSLTFDMHMVLALWIINDINEIERGKEMRKSVLWEDQ